MKKQILFVDDEQSVLYGLKRSFYKLRNKWGMHFASSGVEALAVIERTHINLIVTDMRMPGLNGLELLSIIMRQHPHIIRIVLSGQANDETMLRSANTAHQIISKPCDTEVLQNVLIHSFELMDFLGQNNLQGFLTGLENLPSVPEIYKKIKIEMESPDASLDKISELINQDLAMTAKILQLVNSAFYGLGRHITNPKQAATMLGLDSLKMLVLSVGVFAQFELGEHKDNTFEIDRFMKHGILVGNLSKSIAEAEGCEKSMVDDCFLAGLFHDIGFLVLEQNYPDEMVRLRKLLADQDIDMCTAEKEIFNTTHGAIGAYLLGIWGLPVPVVEAMAYHHTPSEYNFEGFCPLVAVHAADVILGHHLIDAEKILAHATFDNNFLRKIGSENRLDDWIKLRPTVMNNG